MSGPVDAGRVRSTSARLLEACGMVREIGAVVADVLTEAELMGRESHGVQLLDWYLDDLQSGIMARSGTPTTIVDNGAALVWDGNSLPGGWIVKHALDIAAQRSTQHPALTIVVRNSHHLGCHGVYLRWAAELGLLSIIMDTNPGFKTVAPFGGRQALYSPTPVGIGIPTTGDPILIDISMSSTSLLHAREYWMRKERLPGVWLLDHEGNPTDDPSVLFVEPKGSILPLGGELLGHKGFGLALLVYALSAGLSGFGPPPAIGTKSAVFVQLINPALYAGNAAFAHQISTFADACRNSLPAPGRSRVHIPGDRALAMRARGLKEGITLSKASEDVLAKWNAKLKLPSDSW